MKKNIFPIFLSLLIGTTMAYLLINSYDNPESLSISKNAERIYYLQKGVYSNKDSMLDNMQEFENYIYNVEDNMYHVYIGITKNKKMPKK